MGKRDLIAFTSMARFLSRLSSFRRQSVRSIASSCHDVSFNSSYQVRTSLPPLPVRIQATDNNNNPAFLPAAPSSSETSSPPLLLLEGDEFHVSHDGIARTFYEQDDCMLAVEEVYDLKHATKEFVVRNQCNRHRSNSGHGVEILGKHAKGVVHLGPTLACIKIQEIDEELFGSAGTGATTWEASILMALYFHAHPNQLVGDVVEVGCGVGLGGILNQLLRIDSTRGKPGSMTLTDGNERVLLQCQQNIYNNCGAFPALGSWPIQVSKLDWGDFVKDPTTVKNRYDTVIACDCAYLFKDVEPLGKTLHTLLSPDSSTATVHLFGPYNRSALHEVIRYLTKELDMNVVLEGIEMTRSRLKAGRRGWTSRIMPISTNTDTFCSQAQPKFLHVLASKKNEVQETKHRSLSDID